ncbi:MAG: hypothetical protein LBQ59_03895 [Candidatus Peribacteria bacterium]|nr:hypothetical protein [Candidatus Peribacteria bacterium]
MAKSIFSNQLNSSVKSVFNLSKKSKLNLIENSFSFKKYLVALVSQTL